jgi:hypothetical protein
MAGRIYLMLETTKNKYLNELLLGLEEKVKLREEESLTLFKSLNASIKERAMAKAVAKEARDIYMRVRKILSLCVPLNKENMNSSVSQGNPEQDKLDRAALDLLEFREIIKITEAAQIFQHKIPGTDEKNETISLINKIGLTLPATLRTALETLTKFDLAKDIIDIDKLLSLPSKFSMPRGNSTKGGMVKKLLSLGYDKDTANIIADKMLATGESSVYAVNLSSSNAVQSSLRPAPLKPELRAALEEYNRRENETSQADLLAMLGEPDTTELDQDTLTQAQPPDIDTSFDSNFAPSERE